MSGSCEGQVMRTMRAPLKGCVRFVRQCDLSQMFALFASRMRRAAQTLVCMTLIGQQIVLCLALVFGISAINAFYGDRQRPTLSSSDPALFSQIPKMKFQMLGRTASQALQFAIVDAGVANVLSALYCDTSVRK
jgi:hypothetical protein